MKKLEGDKIRKNYLLMKKMMSRIIQISMKLWL